MSRGTIKAYEGIITVVTPEQWGKFLHDDLPTMPVGKSHPMEYGRMIPLLPPKTYRNIFAAVSRS